MELDTSNGHPRRFAGAGRIVLTSKANNAPAYDISAVVKSRASLTK